MREQLVDCFSLDELLDAVERKLNELALEARYQMRLAIKVARELPRRAERRELHAELLRRREHSN
jgi:hypothetical protein